MISFFCRSPRLANLAVLITSIVLSMVLLEGALRVFDLGFGEAPLVSDATIHHRHPSDYRFRRGDMGWNEFGGFPVQYDSQGRAVDPDGRIVQDNQRHTRIVAVMGDSMVEASQVTYRDGFVGLLNQLADPDVFAVDWGVASYSPVLYRIQWMREIAGTKPSLVVLMLYSNDVYDDSQYVKTATLDAAGLPVAVAGPPDTGIVGLLRSLYVARLARTGWRMLEFALVNGPQDRVVNMGPIGGFIETSPEVTSLTDRVLRDLIAQIKESGARFALTAVPSKYIAMSADTTKTDQQFASNIKRWAQAADVDYIDLWPAFEAYVKQRKESDPRPYFVRDIHPNETGHRLIADAITKHFPDYFVQK